MNYAKGFLALLAILSALALGSELGCKDDMEGYNNKVDACYSDYSDYRSVPECIDHVNKEFSR